MQLVNLPALQLGTTHPSAECCRPSSQLVACLNGINMRVAAESQNGGHCNWVLHQDQENRKNGALQPFTEHLVAITRLLPAVERAPEAS